MFQRCTNFIKVNDELFQVVRVFSEERIKDFNLAKEFFQAESVFKKEGLLYFCNKIIDLEVVN